MKVCNSLVLFQYILGLLCFGGSGFLKKKKKTWTDLKQNDINVVSQGANELCLMLALVWSRFYRGSKECLRSSCGVFGHSMRAFWFIIKLGTKKLVIYLLTHNPDEIYCHYGLGSFGKLNEVKDPKGIWTIC